MSKIESLVTELCPNGVARAPLGELGDLIRGRRFTKSDYVDAGLGSIHYGEIYTDYGTAATKTRSFVRPEMRASLRLARTGDLVIAATGENLEDVCKAVAWLGEDEIAVHDDCYIFRHNMDPEYVSFFFQSTDFQDQKTRFASESKVVRVSGANLARIEIPVPPLAIQREIASILDKMESLKAELEAELGLRFRQYSFYRDALLSFHARSRSQAPVRWAKLGEVAALRRGTAITAKDAVSGDVPVVANGPTPVYFHNNVNRTGETIVVARSGAYAGLTSFWDRPIFLTDAFSVHPDVDLLKPKFVFYFLRAKQGVLHGMKAGAGVPHVRVKDFEAFEIPIPTFGEQERIVTILDKFDALVNDLSIGLPAEIAARRAQYEYYRDRLLTFDEAVA